MNQLFVYGTLCPNKANAHILEPIGGQWTKASVRGVIHILDWGPDKGLKALELDLKSDWIEGYLFRTEKLTENWQMLDDFEGFQYQRVIADVKLESGEMVKAWTYQLNVQAQASENHH
ncbi:gamma-glutamylcyclotransferase family protein [Acinetobacter sp. 161(2023)]|uniref:gamma-glutamylcyclotransferase family protein n=1 Tax=Acinetobacter sp. 161(2023) TaxID=3098768 RepID=UPI00300AB5B4